MNKKVLAPKTLKEKKASPFLVSISAVLLGICAGGILILCIGKNPFLGFERLAFGAFSNKRRIGNTLGTYLNGLIILVRIQDWLI